MDDNSVDPSEYRVYWFARDLVAARLGSYAKKETETLRRLIPELDRFIDDSPEDKHELEGRKQHLRDMMTDPVNRTYGGDISKRYRQTEDLVERLTRRIDSAQDFRELQIAIEAVVRTTEILDTTPSFGRTEIETIVDQTLTADDDEIDPAKVYDALYEVDFEGEAYQLGAQRQPLIEYVQQEIQELQDDPTIDDQGVARIVSGIAQEYERRAGQSRAATAGNVLEIGLKHVFDRFGIPHRGNPIRYGDFEIDNLVEGPEGAVGFSCKRTLRERFRQSLSRESTIDPDEVWFIALMMADISREKVADIVNDGGRIYVPRDSFVWERYQDDEDLAYGLRPADDLLLDLTEFTGISADIE